jgi:hypothetical protein
MIFTIGGRVLYQYSRTVELDLYEAVEVNGLFRDQASNFDKINNAVKVQIYELLQACCLLFQSTCSGHVIFIYYNAVMKM